MSKLSVPQEASLELLLFPRLMVSGHCPGSAINIDLVPSLGCNRRSYDPQIKVSHMNKLTATSAFAFILCLANATLAQNDNSISTNAARATTESGGLILLIGVGVVMLIVGVGIGFAFGRKK